MAEYKVTKTISAGSGFLRAKDGSMVSMQSLVPKIGDIVSGQIKEYFIFNKNVKGIQYQIKTNSGESSSVLIPEENLTEVIEGRPNLSEPIGKYKVNKRTEIYKKNPNKKDSFGDVGNDIIGTLNVGDIVEVVELGGGGRGVAMTPYLIFNDGSYIIGYDADKVDNSTPLTSKGVYQKNKNYLLIALALVAGYFAYKKFKNI